MRSYNLDQLETALTAVEITQGATLLVHSSLLHLGRVDGVPSATVPARLFEILRRLVGENGTIVVPTFTFAFCRGHGFDRQTTPSENMGAFSEYVRERRDACRSPHPMQPVSAVGPNAHLICEADTPGSFDDGGAFDRILDLDARVLLIGATFQAVSLVHYAEERSAVPYRYWKRFTGSWRDGDRVEERTYRMFVRDLAKDPRLKLGKLQQELEARGELSSASVGAGRILMFRARDFVNVAGAALRRDPLALVDGKEQRS